jgi:hypothetical protein
MNVFKKVIANKIDLEKIENRNLRKKSSASIIFTSLSKHHDQSVLNV